ETGKLVRMGPVLDLFSPPVRDWFRASFVEPTSGQERGWREVAAGRHVLMAAPTGSGKTLAAFLWCLDRLASEPTPAEAERCRVLYVSPLKALAHDVDRNLRSPLVGIRHQMESQGIKPPDISVAIRTGDTPTEVRRSMERHPPDILITTPESLFLILTSAARKILAPVRWLIVDEIHSVASTKRGSHLALSLERLCEITRVEPQRIGLSATQRPLEEVGRFLGGMDRQVSIVDAGRLKTMEVRVEVPVEDMTRLTDEDEDSAKGQNSIWPAIYPRLLQLIREHRRWEPAGRARGALRGRGLARRRDPEVSRRPARVGRRRRGHARRPHRVHGRAAQTARRPCAADRRHVCAGRVGGREARSRGEARLSVRRAGTTRLRIGARHAERSLFVRPARRA